MKNLLVLGFVGLVVVAVSFSLGYVIANGGGQNATDIDPSLANPHGLAGDQSHSQSEQFKGAAIRGVTTLAELESVASPFHRTVAIHGLVGSADEETLLQLWEETSRLTPSLREETQVVVIQRLAALDPTAAVHIVSEYQSVEQIALVAATFREWSLKNLNQAIEYARTLDLEARNAAVESMVLSREDLSAEQRREIARQLNTEWLGVDAIKRTTNTPLILDPQSEWTAFLKHNSGNLDSPNDAQLRMMTHIIAAWIQNEGVNALDKVIETLPTQTAVWNALDRMVKHIAAIEPQRAFEVAIHLREQGIIGLLEQATSEWAKVEPWSALNAVSTIEARNMRRDLHSRVLETWAVSDPNALLEQIGRLPDNLQQIALKKAIRSLSWTSPQRASEMLYEIKDQSSRDRIALAIATSWSISDIRSTLHWIENEPSFDHNRDVLIDAAFSGLAHADPRQALQVALDQPLNEDGVGPEAAVVSGATFSDMDTAIALLPSVREGKTKVEAYESVIQMLTAINNDGDRAIDLLIQLAKEEEIPKDAHLLTDLALRVPRGLFFALDRFEPMGFKRRVAKELLRFHEHDNTFTTEQISVLREVEQYESANREIRKQNALNRYLELLQEGQNTDENENE